MTFDQTTIDMLLKGIWETIYMGSTLQFFFILCDRYSRGNCPCSHRQGWNQSLSVV